MGINSVSKNFDSQYTTSGGSNTTKTASNNSPALKMEKDYSEVSKTKKEELQELVKRYNIELNNINIDKLSEEECTRIINIIRQHIKSENNNEIDKKSLNNQLFKFSMVSDFARDIGIKYEEALNLIKEVFGYSESDIYKLSDSDIDILSAIMSSITEAMHDDSHKKVKTKISKEERLNIVKNDLKNLKNHGYTTKQMQNWLCKYSTLLGTTDEERKNALWEIIIHESSPEDQKELKKYNNMEELMHDENANELLKNCIKGIFQRLTENQRNGEFNDIGDKLMVFESFLDIIDEKDYETLYKGFKELASQDEKYQGFLSMIKSFKNPETLNRLMSDENIKELISEAGFTPQELQNIILSVNNALDKNEPIKKEVLSKILNQVIPLLEEIQVAKETPEEKRTPEQKKSLETQEKYERILASLRASGLKNAMDTAKEYGCDKEVVNYIIEIANEHPEISNINDLLNELKESYAEVFQKYEENSAKNSENSAEEPATAIDDKKEWVSTELAPKSEKKPDILTYEEKKEEVAKTEESQGKIIVVKDDNVKLAYNKPDNYDEIISKFGINGFVQNFKNWNDSMKKQFAKSIADNSNRVSYADKNIELAKMINGIKSFNYKEFLAMNTITLTDKVAMGMEKAKEKYAEKQNENKQGV